MRSEGKSRLPVHALSGAFARFLGKWHPFDNCFFPLSLTQTRGFPGENAALDSLSRSGLLEPETGHPVKGAADSHVAGVKTPNPS